ncbi:YjbF family lipoprotein [Propionivibrio sp.]|uniref:YjbF family lipoprotein n=1 Tax=Propionivibrio sp. TaxID=2212460 RepID=UPI003BF005CC
MNRRHFLGLLASSAALTACTNNNTLKSLSSAYEISFGNKSAFDPSYPEQLPYASISVGIKNMSRALLVLGKVDGDELHWISADRSVLVTRHGRLVKTVGFKENLIKTDFPGPDFFENWSGNEKPTQANRIIDLTPGNRYGIQVIASLKTIGKETISIGSKTYQTTRFEENCFAPTLSWTFSNSYWVDDNGRVWRSTQQASPASPLITIEVTKPYNG